MLLGNKIREVRYEAALTQDELACFLNTSQSIIWMWESGKYYPSKKYMLKLIEFANRYGFKIKPEEFTDD